MDMTDASVVSGFVGFLFFACYLLATHSGVSWLVVEVSLGDPVLLFACLDY